MATLSPGVAVDLSSTYGIAFWGFVVSTVLYGLILVQGYIYFNSYPKDSWLRKSFVGAMIAIDGVITIMGAESFNYILIENYGDASVLFFMNKAILSEYIITWFVVTASQIFYASRVYIVNKKVWYIPATIVSLALASQAAILVLFVKLFREHRLITSLAKREFVILSCLTGSLSSAADLIATTAMCYFLSSYRPGFGKTKRLIKTLIFYTVNRGVMVVVCQLAILIAFAVSPTNFWWLPPHLCLSKFHVLTLVALLNARSRSADKTFGVIASDRTAMHDSQSKEQRSTIRFALKTLDKCEERTGSPDPGVFSYKPSSDKSEISFVNIGHGEYSEEHSYKPMESDV